MKAREKVKKWLDENPDDWKYLSLTEISRRIGIAQSNAHYLLPECVADHIESLPSKVFAIREKTVFQRCRPPIDAKVFERIKKMLTEHPPIDVAYLLGYSEETILKAKGLIENET